MVLRRRSGGLSFKNNNKLQRLTAGFMALTMSVSVAMSGAVVLLAQPAQADTAGCTVSATLVNSCRAWLGAAAAGYTQTASDSKSQLLYHEQRIGRPLDIVHTYHSTGSNTLSSADTYFANRAGTTLMTDWNPTDTWGNIANQNTGIDQMAASIKALGSTKIFMNLWHEPENDVSPGGDSNCPNVAYKGTSGTVADYRNMWQYVEARFKADGVSNVVWFMDYINYSPWDCLVPDLYPGDSLVDWVMFNGYANTPTSSFTDVVGRFSNVLTADTDTTHSFTSKPWGIVEWGAGALNSTPAQENAYYDSAKAAIDANAFPNIKAYVAYDSNGGSSAGATKLDWRVAYDNDHTFDAAKAAHYTALANDPLLTGSYQPYDGTAPTASLTQPADGSTVKGTATVTGVVSDNQAVRTTSLLVDGADSGLAASQQGSSVSFSLDTTKLTAGTHTLQLKAVDAAGNVGLSTVANVTVNNADTTAPSAPVLSSAAAISQAEVDLNWQPSTDDTGVTGYQVLRDGTVIATTQNLTSYQDVSTAAQTTYNYQITAVDAAGNVSPLSNSLSATTPPVKQSADVSPPTIPTGLSAQAASPSEVDLNWQPSSDDTAVAGYHVYRGGTLIGTVTSGTSFADTGLTDATVYNYTLDAYDAAGNTSPQTAAVSAATPDGTAPSVPAGLTGSATSSSSTAINWAAATDNVAVAGYNVYRNGTLIANVPSGATYADTNLTAQTTYAYQVAAYDAAGNTSALSASFVLTTPPAPDTTPPSTPAGLQLFAASGSSLQLNWQPSSDDRAVAGYNVYRNGTLVGNVTTGTGYTDTGLTNGTAYTYTVIAYDAAGNLSPASSALTASTLDTAAPTTPASLSAKAVSGTEIDLSWQPSTDNVGVASYRVYRNGSLLATVSTGTSYKDTSVTNATSYSYAVAASDAVGNTSAQTGAAIATTPDTTPPSVPTSLQSANNTYKQVNLSWQASSDNVAVSGYHVYRNGVLLATLGKVLSYTDTSVAARTGYTYQVDAFDAAGNASAKTSTLSVTTPATPDTTPPTAPSNFTSSITRVQAVYLSWTASTDNVKVAGYNVYRNGTLLTTITTPYYSDQSAVQGATYQYYVVAFDAASNASAKSTTLTVAVPDKTAPTTPTNVKVTAGTRSATISWTAATDNVGVKGYYVYRNGTLVGTVSGTSFTNTGLSTGTSYSYTVAAFDAAGNVSPQSTAVSTRAK